MIRFLLPADYRSVHTPKQTRHAGTLGSGIDAAVLGVYVHCLLLSTGSILVPIVAHAVFDAILLVAEHVDVSLFQVANQFQRVPVDALRRALFGDEDFLLAS